MHATAQEDLETAEKNHGCAGTDTAGSDGAECDPHPSSVLGKTHLLLDAFSSGATCLGLTELSRRSGIPKATAHRLGCELVQLGYLARTSKGYQLGWRIFELGQLVPGPANLCGVARPALIDLRAVTTAVIHLAVPHGNECVYLERLVGRKEVGTVSTVGVRVPSMLTASGRLFLAHSTAKDGLLRSLDQAILGQVGTREMVNRSELRAEFELIRTRRWSEERERCVPGYKTFAVPITYGASERVIAAVSALVPVERQDEQHLIYTLWATAADVSRGLRRAAAPAGESSQRAKLVR